MLPILIGLYMYMQPTPPPKKKFKLNIVPSLN